MLSFMCLRGFADSLNLSVATALVTQQLFHLCPEIIGDMTIEERQRKRIKWFTKLATQRIMSRAENKRHKMEVVVKFD